MSSVPDVVACRLEGKHQVKPKVVRFEGRLYLEASCPYCGFLWSKGAMIATENLPESTVASLVNYYEFKVRRETASGEALYRFFSDARVIQRRGKKDGAPSSKGRREA